MQCCERLLASLRIVSGANRIGEWTHCLSSCSIPFAAEATQKPDLPLIESSCREGQHLIAASEYMLERVKDHGRKLKFLQGQRAGFSEVAIEKRVNVVSLLEEDFHRLLCVDTVPGTGVRVSQIRIEDPELGVS